MFGLKFSKLPKHRKYSYQPIYYDKAKEDLQSQVRQIKREMGEEVISSESAEENIRNAYATKQFAPDRYSKLPSNKFYGLKIILIASFLGYVFYELLTSNAIETVFKQFMGE